MTISPQATLPTPAITPSPEQQAIISHVTTRRKSLMVSALAGAAKTTTILLSAEAMAARPSFSPALAIAFNSKIKSELELRLPKTVQCLTFNGLGHRAWANFTRKKLDLATGKTVTILKSLLSEASLKLSQDEFSSITSIISSAKTLGYIPKTSPRADWFTSLHSPEVLDKLALLEDLDLSDINRHLITRTLELSIEQAFNGTIDFSDQIWLPTLSPRISFPKFNTVFVDEAQDLSTLNHMQLAKIGDPKLTQYLIFGDPHQSIYGFRGAVSDGMDTLAQNHSCATLPLNTSFRCPEAICDEVRKHVPEIKSASKIRGQVTFLSSWSIDNIFSRPSTAVLCRNNAPLFRIAGICLRAGRMVKMQGKDIGQSLIRVVKKASPLAEADLPKALHIYFTRELETLNEGKRQRLFDQRDCLDALVSSLTLPNSPPPQAETIITTINTLFEDKSTLPTLSSGHKAKGLEWDYIFHLDQFRIPSKFAETEEELRQEENLRYVITTRAKKELFYCEMDRLLENQTEELGD